MKPTYEELEAQVKQLAAENVALKSGAGFFSYGSEHGFEWHKSAKEAIESADGAIDDYRGDACDGWSEEVDSICWGVIMQSSTKVGERPRTEDDSCDPAIDIVCDYALLPTIETPATDAYLSQLRNESRAEGVAAMRDTYHRLSKACEAFGKAEESVFHDAVVDACDQWLREGKAGEVQS